MPAQITVSMEVAVMPMLGPTSGWRRRPTYLVLVRGHSPAAKRGLVPLLVLEGGLTATVPRHLDQGAQVPRTKRATWLQQPTGDSAVSLGHFSQTIEAGLHLCAGKRRR